MKTPKNTVLLAALDDMANSRHRVMTLGRLLEYCRNVPEDDLSPETVAMTGSMICEEVEKIEIGVRRIEGDMKS